ncbi:uncharacterized protein LOC122260523 [Penaeus japonicus]|uniref:uncharacterized protein LOC122260523 n=1 Tax=Penaeus japonicus TaxID=27405 RepID=UPI001C70E6C0|nr:uncharacterized protein LOC122260523 [Penaeus japonicus]
MELVPLDVLWCQCQGNASATPHLHQIHSQVAQMHADAAHHALCYVGVVLALYLLGLVIIIRRSGRSERQTAASAFSSCFCGALSSVTRFAASVGRPRARPDLQQQQHQHQQHHIRTTISLPPEPLQQMPGAPPPSILRPSKPPTLQVHLVVPDDDDEMEISMITSVA